MKFLADESVDLPIVAHLRRQGHQVWYVAEMEPGISDETVLQLAYRENALLLTADKDFGELVFRWRRLSSGVILLRLAGLPALRKAEIVVAAIAQHAEGLVAAFTVISKGTVRIRPQPKLK
jgi:predicted nuclease of predicted toxin-antitoxin system